MQEEAAPSTNRSARSARFYNYLHRYKNLLRKRWWVLPLTLAAGLAVQGYRLWTAPPAFASMGRMIVGIKITTQFGSGYMEELTQFLGTQVALMQSAKVREKAFARVKALKPNLPDVPVDLQISVSQKTTIFNLQAIGPEPEYTRAFLDACMEEYILLKKDLQASTSERTLAGITKQLEDLERDRKRYEEEDISFKTTNSVVFLQEQGNSAGNYLVLLNKQLAALKTEHQLLEILNLDQNLERQQKKNAAPATDDNNAAAPVTLLHAEYLRAKQEIALRKAELEEWSETLKPKHPRMIALSEEIARKERLLEIFKQQSGEQLDSQRKSVALQIQNLEREIKEWEVKSLEISTKMAEYERIRANKQRVQALYDKLLATMQSIGVEREVNPESVTVLERARPAAPAGASAVKALILGAAVGLLAGLGILLLVDRLDDRPTSFTDLQDVFDEPVLGQIPLEFGTNRKAPVRMLQPDDDRHAFLEAYRNLRSSLLYMASEGKRPRTILVTSAIPGDGKSMTAANFAIIMALSGSRVVLVDGDLRKGLLHRHFGLESTPGLNEVLLGQADWRKVVQSTPTANLSLLPRGNTARNPGEMFLSAASPKLIKELSAEFDYVILDTAPVMAADDVTSLSPQVEGVLFVIRASYTSARVARAALDLLYQREVSVLGLVFNGVETNASEYYYYRYKDYYADGKSG